jgi:hypothetical protein
LADLRELRALGEPRQVARARRRRPYSSAPSVAAGKLTGRAVVAGDTAAIAPLLGGDFETRRRLRVHQRNYETSLVKALAEKYPATAWLVGSPFLTQSARAFVHDHPPLAPCIAEYGGGFPEFIARAPGAERVPYLREFAELEWAIGNVSIEIELPAVSGGEIKRVAAEELPDVVLTLQPGLRLLEAAWPVDELMRLYSSDTAPQQLVLEPEPACIQVRGARGAVQVDRLDPGDLAFRRAVMQGRSLGDAAERALRISNSFDPGPALAALIGERLVTGHRAPGRGSA